MVFAERYVCGGIDERRPGHEDSSIDPQVAQAFEDVMSATDIDGERGFGAIPRAPNVRGARAVVHARRAESFERCANRVSLQQIDGFPYDVPVARRINGPLIGV